MHVVENADQHANASRVVQILAALAGVIALGMFRKMRRPKRAPASRRFQQRKPSSAAMGMIASIGSAALHAVTTSIRAPQRAPQTAKAPMQQPLPAQRMSEPAKPAIVASNTPGAASKSKFARASKASWVQLIKEAASDWMEDKAPRLGAALAYYTVFSIAPLLVIALAVAGWVFGDEAAKSQIDEQLSGLLGVEGAAAAQSMIAAANKPAAGAIASIIGVVALIFGASGVFGQMKDALNTIWEVEPKPGRGVWGIIRDRFLTFAMVLGVVFLLLVTLFVSAALAALTSSFTDYIPGPDFLAHALDLVVSLGVVTVLFALIFKYLPDAQIAWKDVWLGAAVTSVLFTIGKYAIGLYIGAAGIGSAYGAAGSIVIVLLWTYYSSQVLFFGAEVTQAYARLYGSQIKPAPDAVAVTAESRAQQGLK